MARYSSLALFVIFFVFSSILMEAIVVKSYSGAPVVQKVITVRAPVPIKKNWVDYLAEYINGANYVQLGVIVFLFLLLIAAKTERSIVDLILFRKKNGSSGSNGKVSSSSIAREQGVLSQKMTNIETNMGRLEGKVDSNKADILHEVDEVQKTQERTHSVLADIGSKIGEIKGKVDVLVSLKHAEESSGG